MDDLAEAYLEGYRDGYARACRAAQEALAPLGPRVDVAAALGALAVEEEGPSRC